MQILTEIFGEEKNVNVLQMCSRAVVVFFIALILIRIAGLKTFGKSSAFDNIITIMMGAMLSRAVAGDAPFFAVIFSTFTMVLMTRLISWITLRNKTLGLLIKGRHRSLFKNGQIDYKTLHKMMLSEADLMEGVRKQGDTANLEDVEEVFIETSGDLSVIKKKKQ